MTCIKDINPASTHHYLILPNKHIRNAKELQPEDASLCKSDQIEILVLNVKFKLCILELLIQWQFLDDRILSTVDIIAEKQGLDLAVTRTGFHWPPFNTIHHLHLHVISPICNMGLFKKFMFKPNSYWFVSVRIIHILKFHSMYLVGSSWFVIVMFYRRNMWSLTLRTKIILVHQAKISIKARSIAVISFFGVLYDYDILTTKFTTDITLCVVHCKCINVVYICKLFPLLLNVRKNN